MLVTLDDAISTHTLTWSVTEVVSAGTESIIISTHTLTWSVTGAGNGGTGRG